MQVCKGPPPAQSRRTNPFHRSTAWLPSYRGQLSCVLPESHLFQLCSLCPALPWSTLKKAWLHSPDNGLTQTEAVIKPCSSPPRLNKLRPVRMHSNTGMKKYWNLLRDIMPHSAIYLQHTASLSGKCQFSGQSFSIWKPIKFPVEEQISALRDWRKEVFLWCIFTIISTAADWSTEENPLRTTAQGQSETIDFRDLHQAIAMDYSVQKITLF